MPSENISNLYSNQESVKFDMTEKSQGIPLLLAELGLLFLFRKKLGYWVLFTLMLALYQINWWQVLNIQQATPSSQIRNVMTNFGEQIKATGFTESVVYSEELQSKTLEISLILNVPETGIYYIDSRAVQFPSEVLQPILKPQYAEGGNGVVYLNGEKHVFLAGYDLEKGDNRLTFSFPYNFIGNDPASNTKKELISSYFWINKATNEYGPYDFRFSIRRYETDTSDENYLLDFVSPVYTTQIYQPSDLIK